MCIRDSLCRESHPLILEDIRYILLSHDSTSELVKFFAISYSCVLYLSLIHISVPENEYQESCNKAMAVINARRVVVDKV